MTPPSCARFSSGAWQPQLLLLHGRLQHEALQRERVTEQLRAALRRHGISAFEDAEAVVLETNGSFSVLKTRGSSSSALVDVQGFSSSSHMR